MGDGSSHAIGGRSARPMAEVPAIWAMIIKSTPLRNDFKPSRKSFLELVSWTQLNLLTCLSQLS